VAETNDSIFRVTLGECEVTTAPYKNIVNTSKEYLLAVFILCGISA